ncbi:GTP-binding protein, partial [Candidatus Microgenomates bacterium]|nr:GTP-binding protein [Candidatus Microgenomates bacterium]
GQEAILDSNDLERERGITIFSKNASVMWHGTKINIIDTPGHADFGGEVERVLRMADGALLLVDAKEGPMPQTRFVLKKALELGLKIIVVINKIDKANARPEWVLGKTFDLFVELGASEEHAFFPTLYAVGKDGKAGLSPEISSMTDAAPIFETILKEIPAPSGDPDKPLQISVTTIKGDAHKGRIATGRISNGRIKNRQEIVHIDRDGVQKKYQVTSLATYEGLTSVEAAQAAAGDIVAVSGIPDVNIGDTIADPITPIALTPIAIEQPTVKMTFMVNNSPFAGKEGQFSTSRQIRERLFKELETDMALKVADNPDGTWEVSGRGELHLAILIERLRREGYEFQVSRPQVIENDGLVPFENLHIEAPEQFSGVIMQKLGPRHGELLDMQTNNSITHFSFLIPTRGLIGYRGEFLTDTKGLGIMNSSFEAFKADFTTWQDRESGSIVAFEPGTTKSYALASAQDRGQMFIGPGVAVYKGQVVGQGSRADDVVVNVCREKQLTNNRSKGEGVSAHFDTPKTMDLEGAIDYISDDELVEVTPKNIRIRKKILDAKEAKRLAKGIKLILLILCFFLTATPVKATYDPLSVPNNRIGVHILDNPEIDKAATMVNSSGGDWGYVTIPIRANDRDLVKWTKFMEDARRLHVIPILRIASFPVGDHWMAPNEYDLLDFANFLDNLPWPTKNRYVVIYNEPNHKNEWGGFVYPEEYAHVLDRAVDIFHKLNSDFFVISAGFDSSAPNSADSLNEYVYMQIMNAEIPGIFSKIDGFSSHSYGNPGFSSPPNIYSPASVANYRFEQGVLASYGVKEPKIFITEAGWEGPAASYYNLALTQIWTDDNLVAVTPFVLDGGQGPFSQFTLLNKPNGEVIKNLTKVAGKPQLSQETPPKNANIKPTWTGNSPPTSNFDLIASLKAIFFRIFPLPK